MENALARRFPRPSGYGHLCQQIVKFMSHSLPKYVINLRSGYSLEVSFMPVTWGGGSEQEHVFNSSSSGGTNGGDDDDGNGSGQLGEDPGDRG